ncbi:unnamed protein product, partial [Timema podura]|nr:unnamed protein product [Timema podura]
MNVATYLGKALNTEGEGGRGGANWRIQENQKQQWWRNKAQAQGNIGTNTRALLSSNGGETRHKRRESQKATQIQNDSSKPSTSNKALCASALVASMAIAL